MREAVDHTISQRFVSAGTFQRSRDGRGLEASLREVQPIRDETRERSGNLGVERSAIVLNGEAPCIREPPPRHAPGTGTTKVGGLTYREAHLALEIIAEIGRAHV